MFLDTRFKHSTFGVFFSISVQDGDGIGYNSCNLHFIPKFKESVTLFSRTYMYLNTKAGTDLGMVRSNPLK